MKRTSRVLFLCLLISMLVVPWLTQTQAQLITKYWYGMDAIDAHGIYYNENEGVWGHYTNSAGKNVNELWSDMFQMNSFMNGFGNAYPYIGHIKNEYFLPATDKSKLHLINYDVAYKKLAEGFYMKFNYPLRDTHQIVMNHQFFTVAEGANGYYVWSPGIRENSVYYPLTGPLVDNISIVGIPNNMRAIRMRPGNADTNKRALFHIRLNIKNSTASNTILTLKLTNSDPDSHDSYNNMPLNKSITLSTGNQSPVVDFFLDGNYTSSYNFGFKLTIDCKMDYAKSFTLESIELYDDMGNTVVNIQSELDEDVDMLQLIYDLGDYENENIEDIQTLFFEELSYGNLEVTDSLIKYLKRKITANKTFNTLFTSMQSDYSPEAAATERQTVYNKLFGNLQPTYYAPTICAFGSGNEAYSNSIFGSSGHLGYEYYIRRIVELYHDNNSPTKPILLNTPILSSTYTGIDANKRLDFRNPTIHELYAEAYITMLYGMKGMIWWWSGPTTDGDKYYSEALYMPTVGSGFNRWSYNEGYGEYLFDVNSMYSDKMTTLQKIGQFLNTKTTTSTGTYILGDLLYDGQFPQYPQYVGRTSNQASRDFGAGEMGDVSRAAIKKVDIMGSDFDPAPVGCAGFRYFTVPNDNAAYFLVTNLNEDGHPTNLRVWLSSNNAAKLLKAEVFDPLGSGYWEKLYARQNTMMLHLPQNGAQIIRISNVEPNNSPTSGDFPRGYRFGVARTESNNTKIILDKNFYSLAGAAEEVEINTNINAEVISLQNKSGSIPYTDFATFRVLNYSYNGTTNMQIEFRKYLQNSDGTFTAQTPATYVKARPNASSTAYKVRPIAYDYDNDGIDDIGYYIAYNNKYFIYSFNGTDFIQRVFPGSTPSSTPEYFNLDATVLGAKCNGYSTIYIYNPANHNFYQDKDRNLQINLSTEKQEMGWWFGSWSPMPFVGDWFQDDYTNTWEFGTYEFAKHYGYTCFVLNFSHESVGSYFELNYGMGYPTDKPLAWIPRNYSVAKSNSEAFIEEEVAEIPSEYSVSQNYPNPFNPTTRIQFSLPTESRVTLEVFNILGERVTELLNEVRQAGTMEVQFNGASLPSGIYIYRFRATSIENGKHFEKINKMMLLK